MIRVLFGPGTAAAANGITAGVDLLLDAGGAGSAGNDFTVNLTLDEGSATIQLMPPYVDLAITGIAPFVSTGVSVSSPVAAYSIAGLVPAVRSELAVSVPLGEFALAVAAPTVATGASVSPNALALGISAVAPEAVGPPSDPDFASVSLLLPFDGADGSTTFTDESSNAFTITKFGDAQISTAQSKFGGASSLFDGSGDYLTCPTSSGVFNFGADNFTIEAWIYLANVSGVKTIAGIWPNDSNASWRFLAVDSSIQLLWRLTTNTSDGVGSSPCLTVSEWAHVAAVRSGSIVTVYCDGASVGSKSIATSSIRNASSSLQVGRNEDSNTWFMNGYIDDLRITKGIARYTANFTPPAGPFPTS